MNGACRCTEFAKSRYMRRLSGPLLDRFDLRVDVSPPDYLLLLGDSEEEDTATVAARVSRARSLAADRGYKVNAQIGPNQIDAFCPLHPSGRARLEDCLREGKLTARGIRRVRLVARTIADLSNGPLLLDADAIDLALSLRSTPTAERQNQEEARSARSNWKRPA